MVFVIKAHVYCHPSQGNRLLGAVTAAGYQVPAGSDEQLALAHLASRMESCLPNVLAWGFDR